MIKLDKNKVYDLSELTSEELKELYSFLGFNHEVRTEHLLFDVNLGWTAGVTRVANTTNAKELFYTLENIQIDCSNETEERINKMAGVFEKAGYKLARSFMNLTKFHYYLMYVNTDNDVWVNQIDEDKTTITYHKFMELFGEDTAEKPQHYSKGIDTFARMEANCTKEECLAFAKGNIDKYNWREKGQDLEDFKKIISYANWAIKLLENEK